MIKDSIYISSIVQNTDEPNVCVVQNISFADQNIAKATIRRTAIVSTVALTDAAAPSGVGRSRGTVATSRVGPPDPPPIFMGKTYTVAPTGGSFHRLLTFSRM